MTCSSFDDKKWITKIRGHVIAHIAVGQFLRNEALLTHHLTTEAGTHGPWLGHDELRLEGLWDDDLERLYDDEQESDWDMVDPLLLKKTLEFGLRLHVSQFLVLCATLCESILGEAFYAIFQNSPRAMHDYIVEEDANVQRGYIKFSEAIDCLTKDELIMKLAERACANAMKGKVDRPLERLSTLTKHPFDKTVAQEVAALFRLRNEIVHEARFSVAEEMPVSPQYVLMRLLNEVIQSMQKNGIETTWRQFSKDMPKYLETWR